MRRLNHRFLARILKNYCLLSFILLIQTNCIYAVDLERKFANLLLQTISYVDKHPNQVWPGFKIKSVPSLLYFFSSQHVYAFNYSPKSELWQKIIIRHEPIYYLDEDLFGLEKIDLAFGVKIEDQPSFVMGMGVPHYPIENAIDFVSTRFHFYLENESKFKTQMNDYDAITDLTNLKLMFLETNALKMYLESFDEEAENSMKDAIAIHRYRTSLLSEEARQYETAMEIQKGLPSFVGIQSQHLKDVDFVQKVEYELGLDPLSVCGDECFFFKAARWLTVNHYEFAAPAYGKYLETHFPSKHWKEMAEQKSASIEMIAQEFHPMSLEEAKARTEQAKQNVYYRYEKIDHDVDAISIPFLEQTEKLKDCFEKNPGIEIKVDLLPSITDIFHVYQKIYQLTAFTNLLTNVYGDLNAPGDQENLTFKHIPLLIVKDPQLTSFPKTLYKQHNWVKFKLSPETKLIMDGKEYLLSEYLQKNNPSQLFRHFELYSDEVNVKIKHRGILEINNGALYLRLNDLNDQGA